MNSQPKWDIYESVVLLNGYLLACKKSEPRAYIIRRVSADLRAMAIHRGRKIDEIFRNENGISYQMAKSHSCKICFKENLTRDEIGATRKLIDKDAKEFFCIDCLADYLGCTVDELLEKIEEFKEEGCTLFK